MRREAGRGWRRLRSFAPLWGGSRRREKLAPTARNPCSLLSLVDEIVWVKCTVNRRLAKSHGYYLQHAKELCLVARKRGTAPPQGSVASVGSDVIYAERRGQSQKPEEIYQLIEALVPGGSYLEIFGRKNNLRDHWVTIGNEVTGTGPPVDDAAALEAQGRIPGAVYGAARG